VIPFELRNLAEGPLYLSCNSNLLQQVLVFEDQELTIHANDTCLPAKEKVLFY